MSSMNLVGYDMVQKKLDVSIHTLKRLVRFKLIPHYRLKGNKIVKFDLNEISTWLKEKKITPVHRPWKGKGATHNG